MFRGIGLARHLAIMVLAIAISGGFTLMGEGWGLHIPKGYISFAMPFSVGVGMRNIRMRGRAAQPVRLHHKS
ncbi:MAG: hypothetical protein ACOY32_11880 [Thermodesulfobacteriota bacterium]